MAHLGYFNAPLRYCQVFPEIVVDGPSSLPTLAALCGSRSYIDFFLIPNDLAFLDAGLHEKIVNVF